MRAAPFQSLSTQRLLLRKFRMEDAASYFAHLGSSEAVTKYMLWQPHQSISESEDSIRKILRRYESDAPYTWAITLQKTGTLIGRVDLLRLDAQTGNCSFAYMLGAAFWNKGYGTEALHAVFDFAFTQLEVSAIEADHMAANPASGAVMRKVGMTCQGKVSGKYQKNETWHDAVCYRITRKEWLQDGNGILTD